MTSGSGLGASESPQTLLWRSWRSSASCSLLQGIVVITESDESPVGELYQSRRLSPITSVPTNLPLVSVACIFFFLHFGHFP